MDLLKNLLRPFVVSLVNGILSGVGITFKESDVEAVVDIALNAPDEARREADITLAIIRLKSGKPLGGE
jgi:hypothetical protein